MTKNNVGWIILGLLLTSTVGWTAETKTETKVEPKVVTEQAAAVEDFKGTPPTHEFVFGGSAGLGLIDSTAGFALIGSASKKIVHQGFAPEINNQVFIETQLGAFFSDPGTAFVYSAHLRWDFIKDANLTPYALGGVAGNITGSDLGDHFELYPRFGVGVFWRVVPAVQIRAEVSHELMIVGVSFPL